MDSGIQMFTTDSVSTISSGKIVAQTSTFEQTSMTDDDPGIRIIGDNKVELVYKNKVTNEEASIDLYNSNNSSNNAKLYIDNPRGTTSLIIDQNRRLGVGNIVPEAILHLHNHNNSNSEHIRVTNNDNLGMNMILTSSNTDIKANFGIRWYNSGSTTLVNNALVIRNLNGTNTIGIGTSTPSYTLDVSGNINFTGTLTQNGSTYTGSYTLPTASSSTLGGIKIGNNLSINGSGVVSATDTNTTYNVGDGGLTQNNFTNTLKTKLDGIATSANNYSLPAATSSSLGGIKVGTNLSIDSGTGVLSATDTNTTYSVGDGGLTQNNFTDALKTKLDGIATSADVTNENNAATATKLSTARTIAGQSFDGSANIAIASTNLSDAATFTAPKSTILATARTIAGQSFDGSQNITIASTNLSDAATFTAPKSTILATSRTIAGQSFNGSQNIAIALSDLSNVHTTAPSSNQVLTWDGTNSRWAPADSSGGGSYTLPAATSSSLGGIKVGSGLDIDDSTSVLSVNTTTMDGQTLETLVGVCDGRSVTVESGTYTLSNVTSSQFTTTSWVDITGSSISYNPPTGTKQVLFEFNFSVDPDHDSGNTSYDTRFIFMIQMLIDGTAVTSQYLGVGDNQHNWGENYTFIGIIDITGTDSVSDGKLSSWSSTKTIKLQVAAYDNNYRHRMHSIRYGGFPGSTSTTNTLSKPKMKIQAIGQKTVFTLV